MLILVYHKFVTSSIIFWHSAVLALVVEPFWKSRKSSAVGVVGVVQIAFTPDEGWFIGVGVSGESKNG